MTRYEKLSPDSPEFLTVLRFLTPLKAKSYGAWAKEPWARSLANVMGERHTEFGEYCLPWDEVELARDLTRLGTPLPEPTTMGQAVEAVADGLCAHYFKNLASRISDSARTSQVKILGRAANPARDLNGARFARVLDEPWMLTVAKTIVDLTRGEATATGVMWPPHLFFTRLTENGQLLPGTAIGDRHGPDDRRWQENLESSILEVLNRLESADQEWFSINIQTPTFQRLDSTHAPLPETDFPHDY